MTEDIAQLLQPISDESPTGSDIRFDPELDRIREARRADDPNLNQGAWQTELKAADWRLVSELCESILKTRSKDLQVAAFLTEAWIYRHGIAGATNGFKLLHALLESYWSQLHPQIEEDDLDERASKFSWLNTNVNTALRQLPLTSTPPGYCLNDWQASRDIDNLGRQNREAYEAALEEGKISGEVFDAALLKSGASHLQTQLQATTDAQAEFSNLQSLVDQLFGRDSPNLGGIESSLAQLRQILAKAAPAPASNNLPSASDQQNFTRPASEQHVPTTAVGVGISQLRLGDGHSPEVKAEALRALGEISAYFRRTEPHNPVSTLLDRAIEWADMPLADWLKEVVGDVNVLNGIRDRIGLVREE